MTDAPLPVPGPASDDAAARQRAGILARLGRELAIEIDDGGRVVWADDRAQARLGEVVGRSLIDLVLPESIADARELLRDTAAEREGPWSFRFRGPDGPISARCLLAPRGAVWLLAASVTPDEVGLLRRELFSAANALAAARREAARESRHLARANAALEEAEGQLVQSEKLRALGLLVASVAHEVNNPLAFALSGIRESRRLARAALELVEAQRAALAAAVDLPPEAAAALRAAEGSPDVAYLDDLEPVLADAADGLERIRGLVQDLRRFARPDERAPAPADMGEAVRATLRVAGTAVPAGVRLETELENVPRLTCHVSQVNQVILNLVTNAAEAAAPAGRVRVHLYAPGDEMLLDVEDSGPGVPTELEGRIFEPFFTTRAVTGIGAGLGLYICRQIARAHGGEVSVGRSILGGALFRLSIPLRRDGMAAGDPL